MAVASPQTHSLRPSAGLAWAASAFMDHACAQRALARRRKLSMHCTIRQDCTCRFITKTGPFLA